jgi:NAD(P)-dependent dehydrogenase (short-subunit alcohol dehydrogenase family)
LRGNSGRDPGKERAFLIADRSGNDQNRVLNLSRIGTVDRRFEGKVALITGVGERGIGAAIAERLADEGAALALLWKDPPGRTLQRLKRRDAPVVDCECDVTVPADIDRAIDVCMSQYGQIDVLVNNAGVEAAAPFGDLPDALWEAAIAVNLTGAMRMTRRVLPYLPDQEGVIVNIASALGIAGCSTFAAYSASKAGLIGMTQSVAAELAPRGIRAVCVAPALVHTPMLHRHIDSQTPEILRQIEACHPLGVGTAHDVAAAVAFLASQEARWITGVTLPLGWLPSFPLPSEPFQQPAQNVENKAGQKPAARVRDTDPSDHDARIAPSATLPRH